MGKSNCIRGCNSIGFSKSQEKRIDAPFGRRQVFQILDAVDFPMSRVIVQVRGCPVFLTVIPIASHIFRVLQSHVTHYAVHV